MPSFKLKLNKRNVAIAKILEKKSDYGVKVTEENGEVKVTFNAGLLISRIFDLGELKLTDSQWARLMKEIRKTLVGAKIRDFDGETIGIHPLMTEQVRVRIDPLSKATIEEAARIAQMTVSDFLRMAGLRMAEQIINEEQARKLEERQKRKEEKLRQYERSYLA